MRIPSLHELQAFEAAARLGSFVRAADELHVTQSAISHRIRALEQALGMPLFARGYRKVTLTQAGAMYRESICEAFAALDEAQRRIDALRRPRLHVAVPGPSPRTRPSPASPARHAA